MMKALLLCAAVVLPASAFMAAPAQAAVTFSFAQVGDDVVLTGSGSLDLSNAVRRGMVRGTGFVTSRSGFLAVGSAPFAANGFNTDSYDLTSSSGPFGTGRSIQGTSSTGTLVGLFGRTDGSFFVQQGYVSGSAILGTTTFAGQSFASLGLQSGTYTYGFGSDSLTVVIPGAIPEPATWAMMLVGFGLIGATSRYRRRSTAAAIT